MVPIASFSEKVQYYAPAAISALATLTILGRTVSFLGKALSAGTVITPQAVLAGAIYGIAFGIFQFGFIKFMDWVFEKKDGDGAALLATVLIPAIVAVDPKRNIFPLFMKIPHVFGLNAWALMNSAILYAFYDRKL